MTHTETAANSAQSNQVDVEPLGLWDAASLIIGIVVGSAIFRMPGRIAGQSPSAAGMLLTWIVGGVTSFCGALCYAELGTTYPRSGGEYHYLTRAYGRWAGFLFGWAQLSTIQTCSIASMSFVFAEYLVTLLECDRDFTPWLAGTAVVAVTLTNLAGVRVGRDVQNLLTACKLIGLMILIVIGLTYGTHPVIPSAATTDGTTNPSVAPSWSFAALMPGSVAMIMVLYAYGGWNDAAFVVAEIRQRQRNIPRALCLGLGLVTGLYLLANLAYLRGLGWEQLPNTDQPPAAVLALGFGRWGKKLMAVIVMISALGAVNGLLFSVPRLYAALGADHPILYGLKDWNVRTQTPSFSLVAQALGVLQYIALFGTSTGQGLIDSVFDALHLPTVPWKAYDGGFETLFAASVPIFWLFFLMTGGAFFVLRQRDRDVPRPFVTPLYPLVPAIFCLMCAFGLYSAVKYAGQLVWFAVVPTLFGFPVFYLSERLAARTEEPQRPAS